jgi:hypothetical protein
VVGLVDESTGGSRHDDQASGRTGPRLLGGVELRLGLDQVQPKVELIGGVRVVVGYGIGV